MVPRVIIEDVEEKVIVPVVREVPVTRMVEVPTRKYVPSIPHAPLQYCNSTFHNVIRYLRLN